MQGLNVLPPIRRSRGHRMGGFSLVEMSIVLLIIGLIAGTMMPLAGKMLDQQKRKDTITRLALLDQAMVNFVISNQRLPCPADGTIASGGAGAGTEQRNPAGNCTGMNSGVVPWLAIGLSESDALDGWGNRITYRVPTLGIGFTQNGALNATRCDPAGTAAVTVGNPYACQIAGCTGATVAGCTSPLNFLNGRGLLVIDESGNNVNDPATNTGAAYVMISHGSDGARSYNTAGNLIGGGLVGPNEAWNNNNSPIRLGALGYFHSSQLIEGAAGHFDDVVSHPSLMSILTKAQLGPRVQP